MTKYNYALLPGDGIGPEVMAQAVVALKYVEDNSSLSFSFQEIACGGQYYQSHGSRDWPEGAEEQCKNADAILLAAVGWPDPSGKGPITMSNGKMAGYSAVIGNRLTLDLYANVRPVKLLPGVRHRISGVASQVWQPKNVDMVIVRENTEDLYAGMGGTLRVGGESSVATDTRIITRVASERVIRKAFQIAMQRDGAPKDGKRRVTCIVKNNVMEGCRLFVEVFREVAKEYPGVDTELSIIDAFTQWIITQPEHYDVCVTTNMFGDIVTDLASVLQGGMGMAVGCNVGDEHGMFEPIHGSAPPLAGKNSANPMAMILAVGESLLWLGEKHGDSEAKKAGNAINNAVAIVCEKGQTLPADLVSSGQGASLSDVASAIVAEIKL